MNELKPLTEKLLAELTAYETKPTKACSLRIRKLTQQLNKIGPTVRKELVAADKAA